MSDIKHRQSLTLFISKLYRDPFAPNVQTIHTELSMAILVSFYCKYTDCEGLLLWLKRLQNKHTHTDTHMHTHKHTHMHTHKHTHTRLVALGNQYRQRPVSESSHCVLTVSFPHFPAQPVSCLAHGSIRQESKSLVMREKISKTYHT